MNCFFVDNLEIAILIIEKTKDSFSCYFSAIKLNKLDTYLSLDILVFLFYVKKILLVLE